MCGGKFFKTFVSACVSPKSVCVKFAKNSPCAKVRPVICLQSVSSYLCHCPRSTVVIRLGITLKFMALHPYFQKNVLLIFNNLIFAKSDCRCANTNYQSTFPFLHKSSKGLTIFTKSFLLTCK